MPFSHVAEKGREGWWLGGGEITSSRRGCGGVKRGFGHGPTPRGGSVRRRCCGKNGCPLVFRSRASDWDATAAAAATAAVRAVSLGDRGRRLLNETGSTRPISGPVR